MSKKYLSRGSISVASTDNPFQTKLSLILTDFEPNGNGVGIPMSEADNIIATAENSPLKILFDGTQYYDHEAANAVGPITNVRLSEIDDRPVIVADAIIWNELYSDVSEYLKELSTSKTIGTSWEIWHTDSYVDDNKIEWLKDCKFAASCIVRVPAYGPSRTRVLSIAEQSEKKMLENLVKLLSAMYPDVNEDTALATLETVINDSAAMRSQLSQLENEKRELSEKVSAYELEKELAAIEAKKAERTVKLEGLGITARDLYFELSDEAFNAIVEDASAIKPQNVAQASINRSFAPEPVKEPVSDVNMIVNLYKDLRK
jgi:hypothetical protein